MERRASWKKYGNVILAGAFVLGLAVLLGLRFDYYYALNDDVLIKDILSGVYTGKPEMRTMQLLVPLALLLNGAYLLLDAPCFGWFLLLCQFGSIGIFAYRMLGRCRSRYAKLGVLAVTGAFFGGFFLNQLVFVQYTTAAGMLGAAAIFWFLTSDSRQSAGAFFRSNLPAVILVIFAFCLRSEMMLLLFPLGGAAGICKWALEKPVFTKEHAVKYGSVLLAMAGGMGLCLAADALAYRSGEWQEFHQFFNDRTEIYDYRMDVVTEYEEHRAFYESIGMSEAEQELLSNYNFGVSDGIDAARLHEIRQYAQSGDVSEDYFRKPIGDALWDLKARLLGQYDLWFGPLILVLGAAAFLLVFVPGTDGGGKRKYLVRVWQAPFLLAAGAGLWMFILLRDRFPERITWPLYLGQLSVLGGLCLLYLEEKKTTARRIGSLLLAVLGMAGLCLIPGQLRDAAEETARREAANALNEAVMDYCSRYPEQLFLADVYSTVDFSEKIMADADRIPGNYDLLGGWLNKSPLMVKKMRQFGYDSMGEAVAEPKGNVRILARGGESMDWLEDYLNETGNPVLVLKTDEIRAEECRTAADAAGETMAVYQVVLPQESSFVPGAAYRSADETGEEA